MFKKIHELEMIYESGNHNSVKFMKYMFDEIEALEWEYVTKCEPSAFIEDLLDALRDRIVNDFKMSLFTHGYDTDVYKYH